MKIPAFILAFLCALAPIRASAAYDPFENAKAAAVFDRLTETFLYEKNSHESLPVASTTKIMTSLLALEDEAADEVFKVSPDAVRVEGSSMGLLSGDEVTLRDLCFGMLLPSGNDAANATAFKMAGSIQAFAALMNERAEKLSMKDTHFSTPSGLDSGKNLSSAHDMALLANEALKNEDFRSTAGSKTAKVSVGKRSLYLKNHNRLLFEDDGFTGVKTGFTKKAGRCLVSSFEAKGREFIIVTLNLCGDFEAHSFTKKAIEKKLEEIDLAKLFKGGNVKVTGGNKASASLYLKDEGRRALFPNEIKNLTTENKTQHFLYSPAPIDTIAGEFIVKTGEKEILALPLYTSSGVELKEEENALEKFRKFWSFNILDN